MLCTARKSKVLRNIRPEWPLDLLTSSSLILRQGDKHGHAKFSDDFKRDAEHQIAVRGYPVSEVSQRLGVSTHSLYVWVKTYSATSNSSTISNASALETGCCRLLTSKTDSTI